MQKTRAERETILRWDDDTRTLDVYTASPTVARRLIRRGYPLQEVMGGWRWTQGPVSAITFRRLVNGRLPKNHQRKPLQGPRFQSRNGPSGKGANQAPA